MLDLNISVGFSQGLGAFEFPSSCAYPLGLGDHHLGEKIGDCLVAPCFCIVSVGFLWFLNYSKMANEGFRTYSSTFWNIVGTSKMFTKSGPVHPLFITGIL